MQKIRRLPTILALFLLIGGMAAGIFLISQSSNWFLQAEAEIIPKQIKITNLADSSFTVSWITDNQTLGFIQYGRDQSLPFTANDDRDQSTGVGQKYFTHHITLKNLEPKTTYFFKIGSEKKVFDDDGQSYNITTGPQIQDNPLPSDVVYGTIANTDGSPASDVIVYLSLSDTVPQSSVVKDSGNWIIPLNQARSTDLSSYSNYDKNLATEELFIQAGTVGTATAIATTDNDSPIPTITLGQNFDFRNSPPEGDSGQTATSSSKFTFEELPPPIESTQEIVITNPSEGETINTNKPAIFGTAPAGETLNITLESEEIFTQNVIVDQNGNWEWSPPENLEPGTHKMTINYTDEQGILHALIRNFTVLAASSNDLPAIEASPSATVTPYFTPTPTPTLRPSSTPTPTLEPSPTSTSSARASIPSTEAGIPKPGHLTPTFFLLIIGVGLIILGLLSFV